MNSAHGVEVNSLNGKNIENISVETDKNKFGKEKGNLIVESGGHRAWYLLNKKYWRTWEDFTRAFRYQWGVKKSDVNLFLELNELKFEKGKTLAEFTCQARMIFERMTPTNF
ncbi:hypothetical protein PV327_004113 [Microctonus hyperodae]|uniref:Retrotransposon gag domain-containing protein n=1 Tax=Microctonus hyperodae TaxID=165561 RepID=A0AA39FC07_MICHY|nr:hypothetical protein PV327_004113 [Microctonus hyperodae]